MLTPYIYDIIYNMHVHANATDWPHNFAGHVINYQGLEEISSW